MRSQAQLRDSHSETRTLRLALPLRSRHVTQSSLSVMVTSASHAESLSSHHAIPSKFNFYLLLPWTPKPKHPGYPVRVQDVSEKCALAAQPHVPQWLMLDYTYWLPNTCIGHVMIMCHRNWTPWSFTLRYTPAQTSTRVTRLRLEPVWWAMTPYQHISISLQTHCHQPQWCQWLIGPFYFRAL